MTFKFNIKMKFLLQVLKNTSNFLYSDHKIKKNEILNNKKWTDYH